MKTMNKTFRKAMILFTLLALLFAEGTTALAWKEGQETDVDSLNASEWMDAIPDGAYISALNKIVYETNY